MENNQTLTKLAMFMIIILGGKFAFTYFRKGEFLLDYFIGTLASLVFLIVLIYLRKRLMDIEE